MLEVGDIVVTLLNELMTSLNLSYDNSLPALQKTESVEKGLQFVRDITIILRKMSSNKDILRNIMEAEALHQLFINHLRISEHATELRIGINILWILNDAINDHMASAQFIKEPRYILKTLNSIKKATDIIKRQTSSIVFDFISENFMLLANCCSERELYPVLFQQNIMAIISSLYPILPKRQSGN